MKILIVAISQSIHTFRWMQQLKNSGHELVLFCSAPYIFRKAKREYDFCRVVDIKINSRIRMIYNIKKFLISCVFRQYSGMPLMEFALLNEISRFKPDLLHTLSFQESAYPILNIRELLIKWRMMPKWLATNWGSDIYYWRNDIHHNKKIREVLKKCDYYSCENQRDMNIAKTLGFKGEEFEPFPNAGGMDLDAIRVLRDATMTSKRRIITLKGYNDHWGRATIGLRALERCIEDIKVKGLRIVINNPEVAVRAYAKILENKYGIEVAIMEYTSHDKMLELYATSRISIGLSLSDGNSTSMLEALALGSFPVQSDTAAVDEWFEDGVSGMSVPPEDVDVIAVALRKAIVDDELVDRASDLNWKTTIDRLDFNLLKTKTLNMYNKIETDIQHNKPNLSLCRA